MKYRACLAVLSAAVLSSVGLAQMPSRFDLSGNLSFANAQFVSAPNTTGSGQVRAFGWQTSGTSHFNRWLGLTSQFSSGYASADAIQLIGYTGAGTVRHYAALAGPRITFASRSRFNPFIEGLGGTDYATTKFTSNGTAVLGKELQSAYAVGGGAQVNVSRRIGLNVEAHYFDTQHSVALLGWTPSHFQLSAGLVFRLSNLRDRRIIVDQQPAPLPSPTSDTQTASAEPTSATVQPASASPVTTMVVTASPSVEPTMRQEPAVQTAAERQFVHQQPIVATQPVQAQVQPSVVIPTAIPTVSALAQSHTAQIQTPAQSQAPQPQPATMARPVVSSSPMAVAAVAQTQPQQAAPLSLGEYARRLREKKQHQQ